MGPKPEVVSLGSPQMCIILKLRHPRCVYVINWIGVYLLSHYLADIYIYIYLYILFIYYFYNKLDLECIYCLTQLSGGYIYIYIYIYIIYLLFL